LPSWLENFFPTCRPQRVKHHLLTEHFPDNETVERDVTAWFQQQPKQFYAAGFQGLVKRWDKCLNVQGDYVEK
jgi:hypothetical protein